MGSSLIIHWRSFLVFLRVCSGFIYSASCNFFLLMEHKYLWAIGESSTPVEAISGWQEYNLLREVAKLRKFGPHFDGFSQWEKERFHYACVPTAWLASYYTLFNIQDDFETNMYDICDFLEKEWVWNPKAGWYVLDIGKKFSEWVDKKYPDRKITIHKVKYGSSLMGTALSKNIPVVTANLFSQSYGAAKSDGKITEDEIDTIQKWLWWHCFRAIWLWYFWLYLKIRDNYFWNPWNDYTIWWFRKLFEKTWQTSCWYIALPKDLSTYQKKRV